MKSAHYLLLGAVVVSMTAHAQNTQTATKRNFLVTDHSTYENQQQKPVPQKTVAEPVQAKPLSQFLKQNAVSGQNYATDAAVAPTTATAMQNPLAVPFEINGRVHTPVAASKFESVAMPSTPTIAPKSTLVSVVEQDADNTVDVMPECTPNKAAKSVGISHFKFEETPKTDLVSVGKYLVHKDAAPSLRQMMADAKAARAPLTLGSAFRSLSHQQDIINRKTREKKPAKQIYHFSAPSGYSEHHTGLAVDFSPINDTFTNTKGYQWLLDNAADYGWYQTFTKEYSAKSGVAEESWHWKFKGTDTAKRLLKNGDCL